MTQSEPAARGLDPTEVLRSTLKSQYHATLAMLRQAVERCPDDLWVSRAHANPFWRIAYHALFYTHLYIQPNLESFRPWKGHQAYIEDLDDTPPPPELEDEIQMPYSPPQTGEPYTKAEVLEYWDFCDAMVDDAVDALDLASGESGFSWYRVSKVEHQVVSLRHIQHHTAQLSIRLRDATDSAVDWVGARRNTAKE
jgi:hypothetical protein